MCVRWGVEGGMTLSKQPTNSNTEVADSSSHRQEVDAFCGLELMEAMWCTGNTGGYFTLQTLPQTHIPSSHEKGHCVS